MEAARQEALRESLPDYYAEALRQTEVDAIAQPEIDITAGQRQGPVAFDAVVQVRPEVSIAGYNGLKVAIPSPLVTDDDVDRQIDRLRDQFGELAAVARPVQDHDHVTIDLHAERDGKPVAGLSVDDYLYEVGTANLAPKLDEQLRGTKVGDIVTFEGDVDGGDPVAVRVLVKDVKEKTLPEVSDEWASEVSEFDTIEELRADTAKRISGLKRMQATLALREEVVKALVELVDVEMPEALVRPEMERRLEDLGRRLEAQRTSLPRYLDSVGATEEQLVEQIRGDAIQGVKAELALRALADAEALEASEEELDAEVARIGERIGQDAARVRRHLDDADAIPTVRSDVRKAKALEWLVEHVEIVDQEDRPVDRADLFEQSQAADDVAEEVGTR